MADIAEIKKNILHLKARYSAAPESEREWHRQQVIYAQRRLRRAMKSTDRKGRRIGPKQPQPAGANVSHIKMVITPWCYDENGCLTRSIYRDAFGEENEAE